MCWAGNLLEHKGGIHSVLDEIEVAFREQMYILGLLLEPSSYFTPLTSVSD